MGNKIVQAKETNLFQNAVDFSECIFEKAELLREYLPLMVEDSSTIYLGLDTVMFADGHYEVTEVFGRLFGTESFGLVLLFAFENSTHTWALISISPVAASLPYQVSIDKIILWDNQLCATILCSMGENHFAFFATDFYRNKEKYVRKKHLLVNLTAFALRAEEAEKNFTLEGERAMEWLKKSGQGARYNEDGTLQPIEFSIEGLSTYLPVEERIPEAAEFLSPIEQLSSKSIIEKDFFFTYIRIQGRSDDKLPLSLVISKSMIPNLKPGMSIRGFSHLMGWII